jgi:hypothetical protein
LTDHSETAWEQDEIESHLRSAMDALTPNVFDKIDLSTPQEIYVKPSRRVRMYRRMRTVAMAAAACLCGCVRRRCFILPESPCRFGDWHRCQSEY